MKKQKGFGLLEILLSLVLLGVGVVGLVAFSRNMLSASQEGRRYEVAMRLAESKLDELRNFNGVVSAASGTLYTNIAAASSAQTISNDIYSISWTVDDQYLTSGAWSTISSAGATYPDRKQIVMTVSWSDNNGAARSLQLTGAISPTESFTQSEGQGVLKPRDNPKVNFTKGQVPDVVAVGLGDGNNKETSKPLPDISKKSNSSLMVQFDTSTYQTTGNNTSAILTKQDNATVYCNCNTGASDVAYLPAKPIYMQTGKAQYWQVGSQLNKSIGTAVSGQEDLCPACCQNHYDVSNRGFAGYYAPLNLTRARYKLSGNTLVTVNSGAYLDACRFIRIDGVYKPAPDWRLVSLSTFPASFLNNATNLANYQAYISYAITEHAKWQKMAFSGKNDSSWSTTTSSPSIKTFNTWLTDSKTGITTTLSSGVNTTSQLISRGIYIDIMSPSYLENEVFKNNASSPELSKIPFQDVNMTLLSNWSSSDSSKGSVTSESIDSRYSRGLLTALKVTYSGTPATDNPITITASSYQGNSGVVGAAVLPEDITNAITSTMLVSIGGTGSTQPPTDTRTEYRFVLECVDYKNNGHPADPCSTPFAPDSIVSSDPTITCSKVTLTGTSATVVYACRGEPPTDPNATFSLTFAKSGFVITPSPATGLKLPAAGAPPQNGICVKMVDNRSVTDNPSIVKTCSTPVPSY